MAWRRARKRQRELQQFHAHHELLTMTTIVQIIEEEEEEERPRRGSIVGRKTVPRDRFSGYWRLMQDYFLDPPVFDDNHFRRRLVSLHGFFSVV